MLTLLSTYLRAHRSANTRERQVRITGTADQQVRMDLPVDAWTRQFLSVHFYGNSPLFGVLLHSVHVGTFGGLDVW